MSKSTSKQPCRNNNLPAWDLTDLYSGIDDPSFEKDMEKYRKSALAFAKKYKGKIADLTGADFFEMANWEVLLVPIKFVGLLTS